MGKGIVEKRSKTASLWEARLKLGCVGNLSSKIFNQYEFKFLVVFQNTEKSSLKYYRNKKNSFEKLLLPLNRFMIPLHVSYSKMLIYISYY